MSDRNATIRNDTVLPTFRGVYLDRFLRLIEAIDALDAVQQREAVRHELAWCDGLSNGGIDRRKYIGLLMVLRDVLGQGWRTQYRHRSIYRMKQTPRLCFVQFMHPGKEHRPDSKGFRKWNTGAHKRKFLEVSGRCIRETEDYSGPLHLWGEWEPESEVISSIDRPVLDGPQFIHRPFYSHPASYSGLQNTDPFVFGAFYYSGCKQFNATGATQLRCLEKGSVVLFGSQVSRKFVIDTVFVIDRWEDHSRENFASLENKVSNTFMDVALKPWHLGQTEESHCRVEETLSLRLYWGATYDSPVDGMFSFFPASPAEESLNGFARPWIRIPGILKDLQAQGVKLNRGCSKDEVRKYWQETQRQVESQGLWCGVSASEPCIR